MAGLRALTKRVARMERGDKPRPSPFVRIWGSFDLFVEIEILPGIEDGSLDRRDMIEVVAALRTWEDNGVWAHAASV